MTEPNFSVNFSARMIASEACSVGNLLVYDAAVGNWKVSTTANRAAANALSQAVALTPYGGSLVGKVSYQSSGVVAQEITGLSAGYGSRVLARTSATGTFERITGFTSGDDVVGFAEPDGRVHLHLGLPWQDILALASFPVEVPGGVGHMIVYGPDGYSGVDGGAPPTSGEVNTMSNVGSGTGLIFKAKTLLDFALRSLLAGAGILVTNNTSDITIAEQRVQITNGSTGTLSDIATTNGSSVEATVIVFTGGSNVTLNSLATPREGRRILLVNALDEADFTIAHNTGSTTANRINTPNQAAFTVATGGVASLYYDTNASRWQLDEQNPNQVGTAGQSLAIAGSGVLANVDSGGGFAFQVAGITSLAFDNSAVSFGHPLVADTTFTKALRLGASSINKTDATDLTLGAEAATPSLYFHGTPGGAFNVIGPNDDGSMYFVYNNTPSTLTFKKTGGSGVALTTGQKGILVHSNGDYTLFAAATP